jgi:hypothetical protein
MASTSSSITILRETLNQLTKDKRVHSDDPLLQLLQQEISDYEFEQYRVQDDFQESFSSIFEILDGHPRGERAAAEYLKQKKIQRQQAPKKMRFSSEFKSAPLDPRERQLAKFMTQIKRNMRPGSPPIPKDHNKDKQLRQKVIQLVNTWNTVDGPVCRYCGQIEKIVLNSTEYKIDRHSH